MFNRSRILFSLVLNINGNVVVILSTVVVEGVMRFFGTGVGVGSGVGFGFGFGFGFGSGFGFGFGFGMGFGLGLILLVRF